MLVDIVRNEWGFKGYISTDDEATKYEITEHHYFKTPQEVVAASVKVIDLLSWVLLVRPHFFIFVGLRYPPIWKIGIHKKKGFGDPVVRNVNSVADPGGG